MSAWAKEFGLTLNIVSKRLAIGWSVKDSLQTPSARCKV